MKIKRVLLIALPTILFVGFFAFALSLYNAAPSGPEAYANSFFRKQSAPVITSTPVDTVPTGEKSDSGISGTVTIGPTCPVVTNTAECADKPYSTQLVITNEANQSDTYKVTSDKNGKFKIILAPGNYIIEPAPEKTVAKFSPTASPQRVVVKIGKYTEVTIPFDNGLR